MEAVAECIEGVDWEEPILQGMVHEVVRNAGVADKLFQKLVEMNLFEYERMLGRGAAGTVYQVSGEGEFSEMDVALKLFEYRESNTIGSTGLQGEVLALSLPEDSHLNGALGILSYDGEEVHYVRKFDKRVHPGQMVLGVVSRAIGGGTLHDKMRNGPLSAEEVRGYGKGMAEAICALHSVGYAHKDIHAENILLESPGPGKPLYGIQVIDFNIAAEVTDNRIRKDWKDMALLLVEMGEEELIFDPDFYDLIYSERHGILNGRQPYSEEEVVRHTFFR